ncbi:MAG: FkbM family methyltransferase [Magnetococcales bacterium]|nr:FkbM family methyltransferase [Magnetococcales bacterium]
MIIHVAVFQITHGDKCFDVLYKDNSEKSVISDEILNGVAYPIIPFMSHVKTIVDIGANIGGAAIYFHINYPDASIYSFEPDPDSFFILRKNIESVTNAHAYDVCCSNHDGDVEFYRCKGISAVGSVTNLFTNNVPGQVEVFKVRARDTATMFTSIGIPYEIDILKVDTEGSELPIFTSLLSAGFRARLIYTEYHSKDDCKKINDILSPTHVLWKANPPKLVDQSVGEVVYIDRQFILDSIAHSGSH